MKITRHVKKLTNAESCYDMITLEAVASPLMNIDHTHRVPLFTGGKECGSTIPLVLYMGLKLKYLADEEMDQENNFTDEEVQKIIRTLLSDINTLVARSGKNKKDVLVAKTLQRIIFRHIVWGDPLMILSEDDLLENTKRNRVHTVADNLSPSTTIPGYLCEWVLEKNKLNTGSSFKYVNPEIKRISREIYGELTAYPEKQWKAGGSFSRRVQNALMREAFREAMANADFIRPLGNPARP